MSQNPSFPLPFFERRLLRAVAALVPAAERQDWSRVWQAELWHLHHSRKESRSLRAFAIRADLSIGLTRDALWLRTDSCRRRFSGTPALCLSSLLGLCLCSFAIGLALNGSWHSALLDFEAPFYRSLIVAPLIVFVAFATAYRRHLEPGSTISKLSWIKRQLFFAVKVSEILMLAFLLSAGLCQPIHVSFPNTSDLLQIFSFVLIALVGLGWALRDQKQRCKQCLHSLATPARVGRPSRNLLEWNGTELRCIHGHGSLSIPEIETSWCRSSRWVSLAIT